MEESTILGMSLILILLTFVKEFEITGTSSCFQIKSRLNYFVWIVDAEN